MQSSLAVNSTYSSGSLHSARSNFKTDHRSHFCCRRTSISGQTVGVVDTDLEADIAAISNRDTTLHS